MAASIDLLYAPSIHTAIPQRNVTFITNFSRKPEYYSGMWWQRVDRFQATEWTHFQGLETASFKAFRTSPVRTTVDWLDFGVTHMSVFWKHFETAAEQERIVREMERYMNALPKESWKSSAASKTIAVIPYVLGKSPLLSERALEATVASLKYVGIGRIVVVTPATLDSASWTVSDVSIIQMMNLSRQDLKMMPRVALRGLQLAMRGNATGEEWLGGIEWKYVYFTEPDLFLHTRPSVLSTIQEQVLDQGFVLSAHRFQPIPHQMNFPNSTRVLPGNFSQLLPIMNPLNESHSCCDVPDYYPSSASNPKQPLLNNRACNGRVGFWWQCGFRYYNESASTAQEQHRNIVRYPLFRLQGGTRYPLVDNAQKMCQFFDNNTQC